MDKNKSIDGLTSRRSKKATTSTPKTKTPTTPRKASTTKPKSTAKKTTQKPTQSKTVKTSKPTTPRTKTTKPRTSATNPQSTTNDIIASTIPQTQSDIVSDVTPATQPQTTPPSTPNDITADFLKPIQAFDFDETSGELKPAQDSPSLDHHSVKKSKKKDKKPVSKKRKIIITVIIIIILLIAGAATWLILWGNDIIAKITGGQGNVFDLLNTNEAYEPLKTDENGRTNILAIGTSGYNMNGDEGNTIHDGAQLTDSIMVISFNQETGDIAMLSLPRDLKVSSTCTATGKINEIYWCNNMEGDNEQAGAEALMKEVSDILGIDFQYYAHLNWGSLVQIVDTLGGIHVTLDEDIEDYYFTGAVFQAGQEYTINGEQALGLARARHGTADGDFSRGASQQKILIGIKDKILEQQFSIPDLINLASTLGDNLRTNFSIEEFKSIAHLASEFDFNSIRQISLLSPEPLMTTGTINGISYVLPAGGNGYYARIKDFVSKMFSSDPRVYEDATILVLNGTEIPGLASSEQTTLTEDGYKNVYVDDAPEGTYSEQYTIFSLTDNKPGTKSLLEKRYNQSAKSIEELPTGIDQNYDFIIILGENDTQE